MVGPPVGKKHRALVASSHTSLEMCRAGNLLRAEIAADETAAGPSSACSRRMGMVSGSAAFPRASRWITTSGSSLAPLSPARMASTPRSTSWSGLAREKK